MTMQQSSNNMYGENNNDDLVHYTAATVSLNSLCAIGYFREHSPAIFLRPQNIIKHALYGTLALYSLNPNLNPNQNRTHVPRYLLVLNLTDVRPLSLFIFSDENTK